MGPLLLLLLVAALWFSPSLRRSLAELIHPDEPRRDKPTASATRTADPSAGTDPTRE